MNSFIQLLINGLALGFTYALLALSFALVYRGTRVINFAQGAMLVLGAYLVSWVVIDLRLPFFVGVLVACMVMMTFGIAFQRLVLRRIAGAEEFIAIMVTLGLGIAITAAIELTFGPRPRLLGDPWGSATAVIGSYRVTWIQLWTIVIAGGVLIGYFIFDRLSRYGLAMRAAASDEEAASATGIPVQRIHSILWAVAGLLAVLGGIFLAGYPNSPNPELGDAALRAFPAVVLGGLASPPGAVVGGLVIGTIEVMTAGYAPTWAGTNAHAVAPYLVMIAILMVRPQGLFGRAEAVRA